MKVGVAGFGIIGGALGRCFARSPAIELHVYDKFKPAFASAAHLAALDVCDVVFVTVPTPFDKKRRRCDVSAVEDVVSRIAAPICIKSTVPPGTTDRLGSAGAKRLAFSPEFMGESAAHCWPETYSCGFAIFGGDPLARRNARRAYELASPVPLRYVETSAALAELSKYMLNGYLATKVAYVNQFYDIATQAGLDFAQLRELFLLDPRVGESHTAVSRERGFGGKCLPKDLSALVAWAAQRTDTSLLQAVIDYNDAVRGVGAKAPKLARIRRPLRIVQSIKGIARRPRRALQGS